MGFSDLATSNTRARRSLDLSTSEKLVKAARECLIVDGAAHSSIKTIAARAGVNHGLVHRHFGSKEALMIAVQSDIDYDMPDLGLVDPAVDAKAIMKANFKDQRVSIELLSLSYQMPLLREAIVRGTRKVLRRYADQSPNLSNIDVLAMGAEFMGLAVYHATDPKMPVKDALTAMLRRYFKYSD